LSIRKIQDKYTDKIAILENRLKRADDKVSVQKQQSWLQKAETFVSFGTTLLGAILGKKLTKGTISGVGTSLRRAGRITKESTQVTQAEDNLKSIESQIEDLKFQEEEEIKSLSISEEDIVAKMEEIFVKPRKSDIMLDQVALVWSGK